MLIDFDTPDGGTISLLGTVWEGPTTNLQWNPERAKYHTALILVEDLHGSTDLVSVYVTGHINGHCKLEIESNIASHVQRCTSYVEVREVITAFIIQHYSIGVETALFRALKLIHGVPA